MSLIEYTKYKFQLSKFLREKNRLDSKYRKLLNEKDADEDATKEGGR